MAKNEDETRDKDETAQNNASDYIKDGNYVIAGDPGPWLSQLPWWKRLLLGIF